MARKKDQSLSLNLTPAEQAEMEKLLQTVPADQLLTQIIDEDSSPAINEHFTNDKNSYAFWGPTTAELVKSPESLYIPISYDAFKVSALHEHEFKSPGCRQGYIELFMAATQILQWTAQQGITEFFLKNATFSGKHRWPFTSNVDLKMTRDNSVPTKIGKIINHIHNINEYAVLCWSTPGLGLLARKKLDLEPQFYAFGSTFYNVTNTQTGERSMIHMGSARQDRIDYIDDQRRAHPELEFERIHIGMPITKEIRIFSIDGAIQGYVPYWTPVAFENQSVYGLHDGKTLNDALRDLATFSDADINHLTAETNKIINHPKFSDTDWAIDWVLTRSGEWYMIDMQTAKQSYMDVKNMKFATENARPIVYNFIDARRQEMVKAKRNMSAFDKMISMLAKRPLSVDENMQRFGYPTQKELAHIRKEIGVKTK